MNKNYALGALGAVLVVFLLWFVFVGGTNGKENSTVIVQKGDLANSVFVFGKAAPEEVYELSFNVAGKLTSYPFEEGDTIKKGAKIATLDARNIYSSILKAKSAVLVEESRLSELSVTSTKESELVVQESKIQQEGEELEALRIQIDDKITNLYAQSRDVFANNIDIYFENISSNGIDVNIPGANLGFSNKNILKNNRRALQSSFNELYSLSTNSQYEQAQHVLDQLLGFANEFQTITSDSGDSSVLSNTALAISGMVALQEGLTTVNNSIITANANLNVAREQLVSLETGSRGETLAYQESIISSKETDVNALYTDLSNYVLKSPISGVVFDAPLNNYRTVNAGEVVLAVTENENLVVFSDVAESDVAFIGEGNEAEVTFDAIDGVVYKATISEIKNRENLNETVPTYKTTFVFSEGQDIAAVRSGMTANIIVRSGVRGDVLYVSKNYIYKEGGQSYVYKHVSDNKKEKVYIEVGFTNNIGLVEVKSGLNEGETVVTKN